MADRLAVALLIETSNAYARGILEGIIDYVHRHDSWSIYLPEQERGAKPPRWLKGWNGNGIIARIENDQIAKAVLQSGLPVVDVSAARHLEDVPWVETDDRAIARLAAEHLIERGFKNLAFCGLPQFNWSRWREEHFASVVRQTNCQFYAYPQARISRARRKERDRDEFYTKQADSESTQRSSLARWLLELPRPIGIMACYDIQAQRLLDVCRELDISVPEEIAVIGVDNDRLLCDLASPSLTSVVPNSHQAGLEAAQILDRLMRGEVVPPAAHLIKPLGIQTRQSTDVFAIDDPLVVQALRYIREHACEGINAGDVVKRFDLSRRVLEHRFQRKVGRTPHEEIIRVRIARVKELLAQQGLTLEEIAQRTGYQHIEYLSAAFKRLTGLSPSQFRTEHQRTATQSTSQNPSPSSVAKR